MEVVLHFVVKQIIISGLTLFARSNTSFMHHFNNPVSVLCQKYGYSFVDNSNISSENFWREGLHLNYPDKGILLNNYVVTLSDSYFLVPSFTQWFLTTLLQPNVVNLKKIFDKIEKMIMLWIMKHLCLKTILNIQLAIMQH